MDNWCGLIPLGLAYILETKADTEDHPSIKCGQRSLECVINPLRTQGIIEFHQKSVKNITLNSKREPLDSVIENREQSLHPVNEEKCTKLKILYGQKVGRVFFRKTNLQNCLQNH